jgi:HAD superfamily hydrolase (TIGR01549 family)
MCSLSINLNRIKAVIFDFDGVILESANIKTDAFLEIFADYPEYRNEILQYHMENTGISRYRKFEWIYQELLKKPFNETEKNNLGNKFSEIVLKKVLSCPFVPGAVETLKSLKGQKLSFIASGTPHEELEFIVKQRKISEFFDGIWGSPPEKTEIIHNILDKYDLRREEVMFVGDGLSDYKAASAAGICFIARETPEMEQHWKESEVACIKDLTSFCSRPLSKVGVAHLILLDKT